MSEHEIMVTAHHCLVDEVRNCRANGLETSDETLCAIESIEEEIPSLKKWREKEGVSLLPSADDLNVLKICVPKEIESEFLDSLLFILDACEDETGFSEKELKSISFVKEILKNNGYKI